MCRLQMLCLTTPLGQGETGERWEEEDGVMVVVEGGTRLHSHLLPMLKTCRSRAPAHPPNLGGKTSRTAEREEEEEDGDNGRVPLPEQLQGKELHGEAGEMHLWVEI